MSAPEPGHIIVGAGLAGAKAAQALRREGHDGPITLIGGEPDAPYNRPPLSKDYLSGAIGRDDLRILPEGWYDDNDVQLRLGTQVTELSPEQHRVTLATGERLAYTKVLLATGSRVRRLRVPGAGLAGVLYLRSVGDSERIRSALATASRIVVVGAGWVGLEVAATARRRGLTVTILEAAPLPLAAVLGPEIAPHFVDLHVSHGVEVRCGVEVSALSGADGRVTGVELVDGTHIDADVVVVGVGVLPRTELAEGAGLAVDRGVLVDASMRSSHPDVFAVGDVANAWHPLLGRHVHVEHWTNASWQPRVAASAMLGSDTTYEKLPYFYSDQYDMSMEYTGHVGPDGYDRVVVRGDPGSGAYLAFWLRDNRVLAGMNVNTSRVLRDITSLVQSGRRFDAEQLSDPGLPLRALLSG